MMANFDVPIFKTITQSAELTGLTQYHIRKLVLNNKIGYIKSGKKFLISINSLINYLKTADSIITEETYNEKNS